VLSARIGSLAFVGLAELADHAVEVGEDLLVHLGDAGMATGLRFGEQGERAVVLLAELRQEFGTSDEDRASEACVRCSLLRPSPAQLARREQIRDNLQDRIAEAIREGWLGEVEGLQVSLAGAQDKLVQIDATLRRQATTHLGMPTFGQIAGRNAAAITVSALSTDRRYR
jgi:hypothetical protein